jgi:hypothetical protein
MTGLPIEEGLAAPARAVTSYVTTENIEGGLLPEVETIISANVSESFPDPPGVWIVEGITVTDDNNSPNLSQTNYLKTPFEFICVAYDSDGIEETVAAAKNLATRVGASVLKNFNRVKALPTDPDRVFSAIRFNAFNPAGEVQIEGKAEAVAAASILFDFVYPIQWMHCRRI